MSSLEGDNRVLLYHLSASEFWPNMRGNLWWEWLYKRVAFGGSGFIRGVAFGESGLIRGVAFGESGIIRG